MLELAQSMPELRVTADQLDADPCLFNCENGTLDLRTRNLHKHRREDLITKISPIPFDKHAKCPRWRQFMREIFKGDPELITFVQRALGAALTGKTEKAAFFFIGGGDNGKTTVVETFKHITGEYGKVTNMSLLSQRSTNNEVQYAMADLQGLRFVAASETKEGEQFNESHFKRLTGEQTGEQTLIGRKAYGSPFEFYPQFKLFIDANHEPQIQGADDAIWGRIKRIPFDAKAIDPEKAKPGDLIKDRTLRTALIAEAPGILNWASLGTTAWLLGGLSHPSIMETAVASYRESMDQVEAFIEACCTRNPEATFIPSDMYRAFVQWSKRQAIYKPITSTAFGIRLNAKGCRLDSRGKLRLGLQLTTEAAFDLGLTLPTTFPR